MMITHRITMDLDSCGKIPQIDAVQDDQYTRNVELTLLENKQPWAIPAEADVVISYQKSDGTSGQYDTLPNGTAAWKIRENFLTLALAPQVLTAAGEVLMAAQLIREEQVLSTFRFQVNVQRNLAMGDMGSGNYVNLQKQQCLPAVTDADEGKFLRVVGGVWAAETLTYAEGVAY